MTEFIVEADNGKTFSYSERAEAEEHAKKIKRDFDIDAHVRVGGQTDGGEVIEEPNHTVETPEREEYDLPEGGPSVDEDPLVWMPDEFTDSIDGTTAINRNRLEFSVVVVCLSGERHGFGSHTNTVFGRNHRVALAVDRGDALDAINKV